MLERREQLSKRIQGLMIQLFLGLRPRTAEVRLLTELTLPQLKMLLMLHSAGELRMGDLATRLAVGLPTATSLANTLEEKGLVTRRHSREDRRVVLCSVTTSGRLQADSFWGYWKDRLNRIIPVLTEDELECVARGMEVVANAGQRSQG